MNEHSHNKEQEEKKTFRTPRGIMLSKPIQSNEYTILLYTFEGLSNVGKLQHSYNFILDTDVLIKANS